MDVVVQPGVNWMDLNRQIAQDGLFLPLDPSPTATVGGMVSTNCRYKQSPDFKKSAHSPPKVSLADV